MDGEIYPITGSAAMPPDDFFRPSLGEGVRLLVMAVYSFGYKRFSDAEAPFAQRVVNMLDEIELVRGAVLERLEERNRHPN